MTQFNVKRGDIYFVIGTHGTGSEQTGERPAIVVSNDTGNRYAPVVEVVYLTTKRKTTIPTHVFINSAECPSIALCEQIVTVCKSRLERYMGSVTVAEMRQIDKALSTSLGIQRTGGNTMQITMKTPFGEMNFDMPQENALDLIQRAFQYAAGQEQTARPEIPLSVPQAAQERPKMRQAENKPHRRIDSLFGDFRGQGAATDKPEAQPDYEPEEYKGFLLIKCEHCGKLKGFCAKTPIREYSCECGGKTELHDLKVAHLNCKCGNHYKYKTNITEERFDYKCLNCGSPVDMELNSRRNTYVTITD